MILLGRVSYRTDCSPVGTNSPCQDAARSPASSLWTCYKALEARNRVRSDLQARHRRAVRRRLSRTLRRQASQEARLFPHERPASPPRPKRTDRRGFQKRMAPPRLQGVCRDCFLISLLQRIRPRGAASGHGSFPAKAISVSRLTLRRIMVLGVDLGKNVRSVVGLNASGAVVVRRRPRRRTTIATPRGSQKRRRGRRWVQKEEWEWILCRLFVAHGHDVRLMSPEYVRPYVKAHDGDTRAPVAQ